jgi:prevent-host-death family protein
MDSMPVEHARRHFADLLDQVRYERKEIVITRHGKPIAKLVPVTEEDATAGDSPPA